MAKASSFAVIMIRGNVAKNNKTHFFFALCSHETLVFDQSEHALGPIYIIKCAVTLITLMHMVRNRVLVAQL